MTKKAHKNVCLNKKSNDNFCRISIDLDILTINEIKKKKQGFGDIKLIIGIKRDFFNVN